MIVKEHLGIGFAAAITGRLMASTLRVALSPLNAFGTCINS